MAYTTITDAMVAFRAYVNQTVMTYIRDNLNNLRYTKGETLYQMPSGVMYHKPDGGGETTYYCMPTGENGLTYDIGGGGNQAMMDGLSIRIPPGCTTARCRCQLRAEVTSADVKIRFKIGTATTDQASIDTSAAWYNVDLDVTGLDDSEQALEIRAVNDTGTIRWVKITRLIIRALS